MTEDQERRLSEVEKSVADMRVGQAELRKDVEANTAVTKSIKEDTEQIVQLVKGGKVLGGFLKWAGALSGTGGGIYVIGKGVKWW